MTIPLVHDITIVRRSHWSMTISYFNPTPRGLPDRAAPIDPSGWTFEWELTNVDDPANRIAEFVVTSPTGITVAYDLSVTVALTSIDTTDLPLMVGIHSLLAVPDIPDIDELLVTGRALVTDGN